MIVNGAPLPYVAATEEQPRDPPSLTSWAMAKALVLRPEKTARLQAENHPQRLVELNTRARQGRSQANRLDFTRPQNVDAVFTYIYGKAQEVPCSQCEKGRGTFKGCVTMDGLASGACANCAYSSRGRACQFHRECGSNSVRSSSPLETHVWLKTILAEHKSGGIQEVADLEKTLETLTPAQWHAVGDLFQQICREQGERAAERG